jgi:hypothetical protein
MQTPEFPQKKLWIAVRLCRRQTLPSVTMKKNLWIHVTKVASGGLQSMGAKKKIDVTDGGNHAC